MRSAIHETRKSNIFEEVSSDQQKIVVTNSRDATSTAISTLEGLCLIRSTPAIVNALSQFRLRQKALEEALVVLAAAREAEQDLDSQAASLIQCTTEAGAEARQLRCKFLEAVSSERTDYRQAIILVSEAEVNAQIHPGDARTKEQLDAAREAHKLLRLRLTHLEDEIVAAQAPPVVIDALALAQGLADQYENAAQAKPAARANTLVVARKVGEYVSGLQQLLRAIHPVIAEEISAINQLAAFAGNAFSRSLAATAKLESTFTELAVQATKGLDHED